MRNYVVQYCGLIVGTFGKLYGKDLALSTLINSVFGGVDNMVVLLARFTNLLHKFCAKFFTSLTLFRVGFYSLSTPPITSTKLKYISFIY